MMGVYLWGLYIYKGAYNLDLMVLCLGMEDNYQLHVTTPECVCVCTCVCVCVGVEEVSPLSQENLSVYCCVI